MADTISRASPARGPSSGHGPAPLLSLPSPSRYRGRVTAPRQSVRPSVLDRMHAGTRIAVVTGPVRLPDAETARARLLAFARLGPSTRVALRPDGSRRRWRHDPESLRNAVVTAAAPDDPLALLRGAAADAPFRVTLAGDYLLTEHDHGIGEIQLALYAMLVVAGLIGPSADVHRSISARDDGLFSAAARVFGGDPRRVHRVLKILEGLPDPVDPASRPPLPPLPPRPAPAAAPGLAPTSVEAVMLDAATVSALRQWRDRRRVEASVKTLLLCGTVRAFAEAGVTLHEDIGVPVDLRRYLRAGVNPLGNFVAGLEFRYRAGDDPAHLQRTMADTLVSGRPVASGLRSSVAATLARRRRLAPADADGPPRLLFSGINEMAALRRFGWLDTAGGGLYGRVDPIGTGDLTLGTVGVHGAVTLSVSFHPGRHDPDVISAALRRFAADPASYLQ